MDIGTTCDPAADPAPPGEGGRQSVRITRDQADACQDTDVATLELVRATQQQVRRITEEIAELSRGERSSEAYFSTFLQSVTTALSSVGGSVWSVDAGGQTHRLAQAGNVPTVEQQAAHESLLRHVVDRRRPLALGPHRSAPESGACNATPHLALLAPLQINGHVRAIVEVFQQPRHHVATHRGYMAYLAEVCEFAEGFLRDQRLRELERQQQWSVQFERFLAGIHGGIRVEETAYTVVNEARRLAAVDRVALAWGTGRGCRVRVISGLDTVERRAEQVRRLGELAARIINLREPCRLSASGDNLPPQLETVWDAYVDISHVRQATIIPLVIAGSSDDEDNGSEPFGALVFEQFSETTLDRQQAMRIEQLGRHSALALENARQHENVFLMPLWRLLGNLCEALGGRYFLRTLLLILLGVTATIALITTQTAFSVSARGTVQPELRRTVFAPTNGIITNVPVSHGQQVRAGQVLAELKNTELDVQITSLVGQQTSTREQILSLQRSLLNDPRLDAAQHNQLSGELLQLQQTAASIDQQLQLLRQQKQQLVVRAEGDGQIVTWHVRDQLMQRPVQRGQALMALVDPHSAWELQLYVPIRDVGHVLAAASVAESPLPVTFVLSSHPGRQFSGTIKSIDPAATQRKETGNCLRVCVAIDAHELPERKADTTVTARIDCGQRSLGYAWFHDLIDTLRGYVLFWL